MKKHKPTTEEFIQRAKIIHQDKYDYSYSRLTRLRDKILIKCTMHGIFEQIAMDHLKGHGCCKCAGNIKLDNNKLIQKAKNVHGDKYDYSEVEYLGRETKITIVCKKHGRFTQSIKCHISKGGGCPICRSSRGEKVIRDYLLTNNIEYEH